MQDLFCFASSATKIPHFMAASPVFTENNYNFFRAAYLIHVYGAKALRQVLLTRLDERKTHLSEFLSKHKDILESFRKGGGGKRTGKDAKTENSATNGRGSVMSENGTMMEGPKMSGKNARKYNLQLILHDQWKLMYPQMEGDGRETTAGVSIDQFDITLVICIIQIIQIIDPLPGELIVDWLNEPDTNDSSWAANVKRLQIKYYDLKHTADLSLDRTTFELEFKNIRNIIAGLDIAVDLQAIDALKIAPMPEESNDFQAKLQSFDSATSVKSGLSSNLISRLEDLTSVEYSSRAAAMLTAHKANKVLKTVLDIGKSRVIFSQADIEQIGLLLSQVIKPIKFGVLHSACRFQTNYKQLTLMQRSAIQFLLDDYGQFPSGEAGKTLSWKFEQFKLNETVDLLDNIISKWTHHDSDPEVSDEGDELDLTGIPSSHIWWSQRK